MQQRSISRRLSRAKSKESKQATVLEWVADWEAEQSHLVSQIGRAVKYKDDINLYKAIGELKAVSEKKFEALPKVIKTLLEIEESKSVDTTFKT